MSVRRRLLLGGIFATPLLLALIAVFGVLLVRQGGLAPFRVPVSSPDATLPASDSSQIARGRYLALLGNCLGCHTAKGGAPLAGGRAFRTDYGVVYSTNLTPHTERGIGDWSVEEFRHAMRHGVSRNGVLSPVFPYTSFQHLADGDLDALLAYLRTVPTSDAPRTPNHLTFPANLPGAMAAWRLLYVRPVTENAVADPILARGAYLVSGIGHCSTCHATRGPFAALGSGREMWGARNAGWFAPALHGPALQRFGAGEVALYLQGAAPHAIGGYGLMADVIAGNLRHLSNADAQAMEAYLRTLPAPAPKREPRHPVRGNEESVKVGRTVYRERCADCHGENGEGETEKYPPLRNSTAVVQKDPINLIKLVLYGAVAPSSPAHPAPYTMPPFAHALSAEEVAGVVNALRWQHDPDALPVTVEDVQRLGGLP